MIQTTRLQQVALPASPHRTLAEAPSPYTSPDLAKQFVITQGQSWFTEPLLNALTEMKAGHGPAALRVSGAPARVTTVRTPSAPGAFDDGGEWSSETCLLSMAHFLGQVYGYTREHNGAFIQQVVALPNRKGVMSSEGADAFLPFHTENSFAATRPDFLLLICRRTGPQQIPTVVIDADEVNSRLTPRSREILSRPIFTVRSPASFGEPVLTATATRVLDRSNRIDGLRLDLEGLLSTDDADGRAALSEVFAVTRDAGTPVPLDPGDVLVIDNRRTAHARRGFQTTFDGQQRWLQRCLVRADFWNCRDAMEDEGVRVL